jgi:hypothetical protein
MQVINKTDLAAAVGADLSVMERDALRMREGGPFVFAQVQCQIPHMPSSLFFRLCNDNLTEWSAFGDAGKTWCRRGGDHEPRAAALGDRHGQPAAIDIGSLSWLAGAIFGSSRSGCKSCTCFLNKQRIVGLGGLVLRPENNGVYYPFFYRLWQYYYLLLQELKPESSKSICVVIRNIIRGFMEVPESWAFFLEGKWFRRFSCDFSLMP